MVEATKAQYEKVTSDIAMRGVRRRELGRLNVFNGTERCAICLKEDGKAIDAIELKLNGHTDMMEHDRISIG